MNIPLLRRIQKVIDKNPDQFRMIYVSQQTDCGWAYCIGGWACLLSGVKHDPMNAAWASDITDKSRFVGQSHLELTDDQAAKLVFMRNWPEQFQAKDGDPQLPMLAIKRIEHFIQTNGEE